jgi:hypothetical protein
MHRRQFLSLFGAFAAVPAPCLAGELYPGAVARAAAPPTYPPPEDIAGFPFDDLNLKLVVLDSLRDAKLIDLGSPKQLAEHVLGRPVILEQEGHRLIRPVYDYLTRYPVTPAQIDKIETITFDGGDEIYPYAYFYWDGQTADFDVKSLEGIGLLRNLRSFIDIALLDDSDLAHIATLTKLEYIDLDHERCDHPDVLLSLPNLREVKYPKDAIPERVRFELISKGVTVKVYG